MKHIHLDFCASADVEFMDSSLASILQWRTRIFYFKRIFDDDNFERTNERGGKSGSRLQLYQYDLEAH